MKINIKLIFLTIVILFSGTITLKSQKIILIQPNTTYMDASTMANPPVGGDTIKVVSGRIQTLKFRYLTGTLAKPIVIINTGGQVSISTTAWGALAFENCNFIKVTGTGDPTVHYGFKLQGIECGLSFSEYSSDCEAEFVEILGSGHTFFGIFAKKDFGGTPPVPYPQFNNLLIHDNYIHHVTEGMYIGETKSPGMEFRHVRVYNNIVDYTERESVQMANCVEDIEVHNNLFRNSGTANEAWQNNCFQIGGNTVGKYYNNIMINSPGYGIIVMGMGNIEVYSNYVENCISSFIDDRYWTLAGTSIIMRNNYFKSSKGTEVVKNLNQYNRMFFQDNSYDTNIPFLSNSGGAPPVLINTGNTYKVVSPIQFEVVNGIFKIYPAGPVPYIFIGPASPTPPTSARIPLNPLMFTDLVTGGSVYSPKYLVDEQSLNPDLNQHPVSSPWKPAKTLKYAPFHVYLDLGADYYIDRISLHDLATTGKVVVSYGSPASWTTLFTDPATKANIWANQSVRIVTRYIRLTMSVSLDSKINELAIYGFKMSAYSSDLNSGPELKSGIEGLIADQFTMDGQEPEFVVFPNPVSYRLTISPFNTGMSVEILNIAGNRVLSGKTESVETSQLPQGAYFVRVTDQTGKVLHRTKIIKGQ
jgi:hypothetical protein